MAKNTNTNIKKLPPIENPELEAVIAELKQGNSPEKQQRLIAALRNARLLSPCDFDADIEALKEGKPVNPTQIKFYLLNTNDGHTFFPAYTQFKNINNEQFGKDVMPKEVVRTCADFDKLLQDPNNKAQGIVINPGIDNFVVPAVLLGIVSGRNINVQPVKKPDPVVLNISYTEPTVYPTKMANAIYERAEETEEITAVWLKMKVVGRAVSFFIVVKSDVEDEKVLNEIREVAVPLAKDVPVEAVFYTEELQKAAIKDSVALYDKELEF